MIERPLRLLAENQALREEVKMLLFGSEIARVSARMDGIMARHIELNPELSSAEHGRKDALDYMKGEKPLSILVVCTA